MRAKKGGGATGPSPVDRRKTGSKHHLICDGRGTPLHVITTAANVNDITQPLTLIDGIPPVAGRPGRPRRRPEAVLGDKAYDSKAVRHGLRDRRIMPVISRKGAPNIKGLGKLRYVVEQTFALLHQFKRSPSDGNDVSNSTTPSSHFTSSMGRGEIPHHDLEGNLAVLAVRLVPVQLAEEELADDLLATVVTAAEDSLLRVACPVDWIRAAVSGHLILQAGTIAEYRYAA
ncbi:transposase [Streptomyces sp. NPDC050982]|uniref:transposase n=1 Tax=Streptomyces sp. NPDC050982 TaxID=3154746 RepID=UPI0033C0C851